MSLSSRNWFRGLAATSAAVVFAVAGGAAAHADDVYNTLDTTIDTTVESTSVQQGASTSGLGRRPAGTPPSLSTCSSTEARGECCGPRRSSHTATV